MIQLHSSQSHIIIILYRSISGVTVSFTIMYPSSYTHQILFLCSALHELSAGAVYFQVPVPGNNLLDYF